jgi:predicted secreted protein
MMLRKLLLMLAFFAALAGTASAAAHDAAPTYDRVNFRVSASRDVDNDTLVAVMYRERSGQQPASMADDVNRTIAWAVDLAGKTSGIKVQTLQYRQEPIYRNQSISSWKVRQSIRLESKDVTALSELIGELQSRLSVASLRYTISAEVRRKVEDELITQALDRFRRRGELITGELGRPDYRIVNIDITTSGGSPAPLRMRTVSAMAESSGVTAPTLEPGVQSVTVSVSGTIELEVGR